MCIFKCYPSYNNKDILYQRSSTFWHQELVSWKTSFPPDGDSGGSSGSNASDGEKQMELGWPACRSPPVAWPRFLGAGDPCFILHAVRFIYLFLIFYWREGDLQCCVSFRCTIKWISYVYTCISSSFLRFFSHISHYRVLSRVLSPINRFLVVIYFVNRMWLIDLSKSLVHWEFNSHLTLCQTICNVNSALS